MVTGKQLWTLGFVWKCLGLVASHLAHAHPSGHFSWPELTTGGVGYLSDLGSALVQRGHHEKARTLKQE